jgi:hypothetical protein
VEILSNKLIFEKIIIAGIYLGTIVLFTAEFKLINGLYLMRGLGENIAKENQFGIIIHL